MIIFFPQLTIYHRVLLVVYLLHQVLFFLIQLFTLSLIFHFVSICELPIMKFISASLHIAEMQHNLVYILFAL